MKKYMYGILLALVMILPARGMKRTLESGTSNNAAESGVISLELPADAWKHMLRFLTLSHLKMLAKTNKFFSELVSTFIAPDPLKMSELDRKRELLVAFKNGDIVRAKLLLSALPHDIFKEINKDWKRYAWAALELNVKKARCDQLERFKTGLFGDWYNYKFLEAVHLMGRLAQKSPESIEEQLNLYQREWIETRHTRCKFTQPVSFDQLLQYCLFCTVISNNNDVVDKLLTTQVFASHFAQTKDTLKKNYYACLTCEARLYANPCINVSIMKWILSSPLSVGEKSAIYSFNVVDAVIQNNPKLLAALVNLKSEMPANAHQAWKPLSFYIALLREKNECVRVLIDSGVCPHPEFVPEFAAGTLFDNQRCMQMIVEDIITLSESAKQQLKEHELDIIQELVKAPQFQGYLCALVEQRVKAAKELDSSADATFITLLIQVLWQNPSPENRVIQALFATDITAFKTVFQWPACWPGMSSFSQNISYDIELYHRVYLLNRILYSCLVLEKYEYLQSILNENWKLTSYFSEAVMRDWFERRNLKDSDLQNVGGLDDYHNMRVNDDYHNMRVMEMRDVLKRVPIPEQVREILKICCMCNGRLGRYQSRARLLSQNTADRNWSLVLNRKSVYFSANTKEVLYRELEAHFYRKLMLAIYSTDADLVNEILKLSTFSYPILSQALAYAQETQRKCMMCLGYLQCSAQPQLAQWPIAVTDQNCLARLGKIITELQARFHQLMGLGLFVQT